MVCHASAWDFYNRKDFRSRRGAWRGLGLQKQQAGWAQRSQLPGPPLPQPQHWLRSWPVHPGAPPSARPECGLGPSEGSVYLRSSSSPRAVPAPCCDPCPALSPHPRPLPAPGSSSAHGSLWTSCPPCTTRWATCNTTCNTRTSLSPCAKAPTPASTRPSGMCWRSPSPLLPICTKSACWTRSSMTQVWEGVGAPAQPPPDPTPSHSRIPLSLLPSSFLVSHSLLQARPV